MGSMRANPRIFTGMTQKKALCFHETVSNKDAASLELPGPQGNVSPEEGKLRDGERTS